MWGKNVDEARKSENERTARLASSKRAMMSALAEEQRERSDMFFYTLPFGHRLLFIYPVRSP